jgi:SAM-dependent methyltransferase
MDDPFFAVRKLKHTGESDPLRYYFHPVVGFLFRERIAMGLRLLKGSYKSLLEVGYGSGFLLPYWEKISDRVSVLDLDAEPSKVLKDLKNVTDSDFELQNGSILKTNYPDNTFDCIVAFSILEHVAEADVAVDEMLRISTPGATILIGMPAVNKMMEYGFRSIGFKQIGDHHVTTPQEFLKSARRRLTLIEKRTLPFNLPVAFGLYHTFLFQVPLSKDRQ